MKRKSNIRYHTIYPNSCIYDRMRKHALWIAAHPPEPPLVMGIEPRLAFRPADRMTIDGSWPSHKVMDFEDGGIRTERAEYEQAMKGWSNE